MEQRIGIVGLGAYAPPTCVSNRALERHLKLAPGFIEPRTGIKERRRVKLGDKAYNLATIAAQKAMIDGQVSADEIDLIIVATSTPDNLFPSTACMVQRELGIESCMSFDLSAACAGFMYGYQIAETMLHHSDRFSTALVIGVDLLTRNTSKEDPSTAILFGDAAGASLHQKVPDGGLMVSRMGADATKADLLMLPLSDGLIHMQGRKVFKEATKIVSTLARSLVQDADLALGDIDKYVFHQANLRIIEVAVNDLGINPDDAFTNIDKYGNTSAASIPLALDEMHRKNMLRFGDLVLLAGFGAGMTYGGAIVEWTRN